MQRLAESPAQRQDDNVLPFPTLPQPTAVAPRAPAAGTPVDPLTGPPNTRRAYKSAWAAFSAYCLEVDRRAIPAAPATVMGFLAAQRAAGAKLPRLKQLRAAIRRWHRVEQIADPCKHELVQSWWKDMLHDSEMTAQRPGKALLHESLRTVMESLTKQEQALLRSDDPNAAHDRLAIVRDRALILAIFYGPLLRAEVATLKVENMHFDDDERTVSVDVRKSDWHPFRSVTFHSRRRIDLDPVHALRAWKEQAEVVDSFFFRPIDRFGRVLSSGLNGSSIIKIWARRAGEAGLTSDFFKVKTLREGGMLKAHIEEHKSVSEIVDLLGLHEISEPLIANRLQHYKSTQIK